LAIFIAIGTSCKSKIPKKENSASFNPKPEVDLTYFFEAEQAFINGKYTRSRESFRALSNQFPDSSGIWARIATTYAEQNDFRQAIATLDTALVKEPDNYEYLHLQAQWLAKNSQTNKSSKAFLALSNKNHKSWSLLEDAAKNAYYNRDNNLLIEVCDTWSKRFGLNDRNAFYYLQAYDRNNDSANILSLLKALELKYPDRERYGKKRLKYLASKGYYKQAVIDGEKAFDFYNNDESIALTYLKVCVNAPEWEKANRAFETITSQANFSAGTYVETFNMIHERKERFKNYDSLLVKSNKLLQGESEWDLYYSGLQSIQGSFDLAIQNLQKAVRKTPSNIAQWEKLLQLQYFTKNLDLKTFANEFAEMYPFMNLCRLYQKAAGVEPGFLVTGITDEYLSAINARDIWLNKPLQAQAIYEENCSNSSNPIILYWMHELYKSINKDDLAFEYLEKAKKNGAVIEE